MPESQSSQRVEEVEGSVAYAMALLFIRRHLGDKRRSSGETYVDHDIATARTLISWGLPKTVVIAGLLHSSLGSGDANEEEMRTEFGPEVLRLIKGARSLSAIKYQGMDSHVEDFRRFFIAFAKDLRIIFISFAHRLETLRNLAKRSPEDQARLAREILEIYAPLANRLGMGKLKAEFETRAFPHVYPKEYKLVASLLKKREKEATKNLEKIYRSLRKELAKESTPVLKVDYRLKNIYSLYKKLGRYDMDIKKISDLMALRIVTDSVENCYRILGQIHKRWKPVPSKVKDYIANPKPNGYRSIHTTIYTGDGSTAEIQIRTEEMHSDAEYGAAAHLFYEEMGKPKSAKSTEHWQNKFAWVKQLVELANKNLKAEEFARALEIEIFRNRIFVFTPAGDVIELPEGATPIDFAYAVHSDLGNHAHGAMINRKYGSLDKKLHGGETIEIQVDKRAAPSSKWLDTAITSDARKKIKAYLAKHKHKSRI